MRLFPTKIELFENFATPKIDLQAGLTVAIVALPLALAFGVASGLGAASGVTTALIAGFVAAVLGGSRFQVSGPTGAMTVVLLPIMHEFGRDAVLAVGLMAGILLVVTAFAGLGSHIHRIPLAIIEGFTAGIAVVITLQQFPAIMGVKVSISDRVWQTALDSLQQAISANPWAIAIALTTAGLMLIGRKFAPSFPFALVGVSASALIVGAAGLSVDTIGELPQILGAPSGEFLSRVNVFVLLPSALAVATLAALESLLSAKIADGMASAKVGHDSNRELFGQGISNLLVPFFGGVPATAALARTAVNVNSGARSRLSAASHAIFLGIAVFALPQLVAQIPIAALAGVLIATTARMIRPSELAAIFRESKLDAILLTSTFVVTVLLDLISAVVLGLMVFWLLRKSRLSLKTPMETPL